MIKLAELIAKSEVASNKIDADELFVVTVFADEGRELKRIRPRARGSADRISKRQSHLTIIVGDKLN